MNTLSTAIAENPVNTHESRTKPYELYEDEMLVKQRAYESNARTYPRRLPLVIEKASGIYVTDTAGRVYFDCLCGAGALALGHNHPAIVEAIRQAIDQEIPLLTLDITTPVKDRFVSDLFASLPENFARNARIQFCSPSGADGIEAAIKLVKIATGRRGILAFQGSYHGMTHGALAVTSLVKNKENLPGLMPDVVFLPFPYDYRCPFGIGGEAGEQVNLHYLDHMLKDPCSGLPPIAGMLVEVVQGEGGCLPASDTWLRGLRELTLKYDIPLIIDEVQTGIGRTGAMFAFERSGIVPDVIVISKSIGGTLPLSMIVYNNKFDKWTQGAHVGTFRGNQLAMAAGSAVLKTIHEEDLLTNANIIGHYFQNELKRLQHRFPFLADVRGRGLMVAAEVVDIEGVPDKRHKFPPHFKLALAIQYECFRRGLIIELGGREDSTVRFLPPLTITQQQAAEIMQIFEEAVTACAGI